MLGRAWGRSVALLFRSPSALVVPNLQASLICGALVPVYALALAAKAAPWVFVLLKTASVLMLWMLFSWLAFSARKGFEDPRYRSDFTEIKAWMRGRGPERFKSGVIVFAGVFWAGLALNFYRTVTQGTVLATLIFGAGILGALTLTPTLLLNVGLASRVEVESRAEWKASLFMTLAFFPQCLGALFLSALLSGVLVFVSGTDHWWGRLLWAPAMALPVFGAALIAALLVALSDEFLARSHGVDPPAYEPFRFGELIRPWR